MEMSEEREGCIHSYIHAGKNMKKKVGKQSETKSKIETDQKEKKNRRRSSSALSLCRVLGETACL